ncbi:MAG TPA: cytochrome P450 [Blastocatellia bacterium]|nr:cytochrome P450 [Blastocatellia bacterium]
MNPTPVQTASIPLNPPGPKRKPVIGYLREFRHDPPAFLTKLAREHGDVVHFKLGPQDMYLLNHPDYIRDVLVTNNRNFVKSRGMQMAKKFLGESLLTSEGEFHRRQRRLAQPAFHRQRINSYADAMIDHAFRTRERWQDEETLDMWQEMMRLTLSIVGKTLFDADVEAEATEIRKALTDVMQLFERITNPFSVLLDKLPLPANLRWVKAKARLDETIYRIINERRASGRDQGDLLSMLLLAQDEEGDGSSMTNQQLRDEAMTLFVAGHETTANALTWTWYLLSQNPEVESKLHSEIDEVLCGRKPEAHDFMNLRYTEMVFAESMRLYPPAWTMGRRVLSDYRVDRYVIPSGSIILMSPWVMHHDPRFYPDPYKFDPERWRPDARDARPKFSYFPFGGGPRVCIGEQFAWMEGVLLIATIAQKWKMRLAPGHLVEPKAMVTLRPKYGMRMVIEARELAFSENNFSIETANLSS